MCVMITKQKYCILIKDKRLKCCTWWIADLFTLWHVEILEICVYYGWKTSILLIMRYMIKTLCEMDCTNSFFTKQNQILKLRSIVNAFITNYVFVSIHLFVAFCGLGEIIFGGPIVIALELIGLSLPITWGGLMLYMQRLGVSLMSKSRMFWWTSLVPIIKSWPTLKSAVFDSSSDLVLPPLIGGVVWSVSPLGMQKYSQSILMASSPEILQMLDLDSYGWTDPLGMFSHF